jgi:uncharacterized RDD family membrane protein YckC
VARVVTTSDPALPHDLTHIYLRRAFTDALAHFSDVPARVISMANSDSRLAVLCDNGTWLLLSADESVSGKPIDGAKMVALASDNERLWAIGVVPAAPGSTQPGTAPARAAGTSAPAATHSAAAMASAAHLMLYMFNGDTWQPADGAALPANLPTDAPLSLAIIDHVRYVAIRRGNNTVVVLKQAVQPAPPSTAQPPATRPAGAKASSPLPPSPWREMAQFSAPGAFKLLPLMSPVSIWVGGADADQLMQFPASGPARTIALQTSTVPLTERTGLYAINGLREIAVVDGKLAEQDYDPRTLQFARTQVLDFPSASASPAFSEVYKIAIAVGLIFAILSSMKRRKEGQDQIVSLENLEIADLARRLLAGMIDAFPFAVPLVMVLVFHSIPELVGKLALAGAFVIYLIHTAASEALAGRTLGKRIVGLRVVRTDGGTPDAAALLIRNFLRIVDVGLIVPLVFIIFSPLRQRVGDVAAGTIVIRDRVRPEGNLVDPPKAEETEAAEAPRRAEPPPAVDGE